MQTSQPRGERVMNNPVRIVRVVYLLVWRCCARTYLDTSRVGAQSSDLPPFYVPV